MAKKTSLGDWVFSLHKRQPVRKLLPRPGLVFNIKSEQIVQHRSSIVSSKYVQTIFVCNNCMLASPANRFQWKVGCSQGLSLKNLILLLSPLVFLFWSCVILILLRYNCNYQELSTGNSGWCRSGWSITWADLDNRIPSNPLAVKKGIFFIRRKNFHLSVFRIRRYALAASAPPMVLILNCTQFVLRILDLRKRSRYRMV